MAETMNNIAVFITNYAAELILGFFILAVLTALVLLIALIRRKPQDVIAGLQDNFIHLANKQQRLEGVIKDEITSNRQETAQSARQARQELGTALKLSSDSLQQRLSENIRVQKDQLDSFSKQLMAMTQTE